MYDVQGDGHTAVDIVSSHVLLYGRMNLLIAMLSDEWNAVQQQAKRHYLCNLAAIKNMCIYDAFGVTGINTKLPALPWQSPALP